MDDKTILYVTPALPVGGAEKFLALLANSLVGDVKSQTVVSLSNDNKLQEELNKTIRFLALPRSGRFDIAPLKTLRKLIYEERPNIIFCLNFFSFFFIKLAIAGFRVKPTLIISYHSTIQESRKQHLLHKLYGFMSTNKDLIITVCRFQENYTALNYRIPYGRFKTIHNGIDISKWHLPETNFGKAEVRNKFGIPENALVIVMAAAFRPEKNHIGAIRALPVLHSAYHNQAYLLLVGGGILIDQCRALVKEQNMTEFIKFTGPQEDVRPFYWASNIFTLCSTTETFSIAALEAMACGLPAVLTNRGGAGEMIVPKLNGFLCEPDKTDIALKWSMALKTDFSPEAIHSYIGKNFNSEKMIEEYRRALHLRSKEV